MSIYKKSDIIECEVTGISEYGFFVKTNENYSGLVHISQISNYFVRSINDYVEIGQVIKAQIIEVDEKNRRLKLSIKDINYNDDQNFVEPNGFVNLKKNLGVWIKQTLQEINKD